MVMQTKRMRTSSFLFSALISACMSGILILLALATPASSQAGGRVRIMPLGDSITSSKTGHASYRYWLWHSLQDADYKVNFVGSMHGVYAGPPLYPDFDQDHEGHWGWTADGIASHITNWATTYQPNVVLLMIGSSDLAANQSIDSTANDIQQIILNLRAVNARVTILLAKLTPSRDPDLADIPKLNRRIRKLALQDDTKKSRVLLVNQYIGFDPATDTWDGTHPNESGEKKISQKWFDALQTVLPAS